MRRMYIWEVYGTFSASKYISSGAKNQPRECLLPSQGTTATAGESTNSSRDDPRLAAGSFDGGMSRAAEAREAVAAKRSISDKDERERRALRERRDAIEAARCAEYAEGGCREPFSGTVGLGKLGFRVQQHCTYHP